MDDIDIMLPGEGDDSVRLIEHATNAYHAHLEEEARRSDEGLGVDAEIDIDIEMLPTESQE